MDILMVLRRVAGFAVQIVIVVMALILLYAFYVDSRPASGQEAINPIVVDAVDLGIGSNKYKGKTIKVRRVRCYYADVDDYRCLTGANVSIFTKTIVPATSKQWIEEHCDTLKKTTLSSDCITSATFVYSEVRYDIVSGYQQRTILLPDQIRLPSSIEDPPRPRR